MFGLFKKKQTEEQKESKGLIARLRQGLTKTRSGFTGRLDKLLFGKKEINEDLLEDLEEVLFTSDLGVATTQELIRLVQEGVARKELVQPEKLRAALKEHIRAFLNVPDVANRTPHAGEPYVIMMIGVNGVGKTTTIGKLGHQLKGQGNSVMFVAADTFRAAAVEQLEIWAQRVGADLVKQGHGADPSAVVFDALSSALSKQTDVVLIDTAGRLHTKIIAQAELFHKAIGLTGIVLTKLDGTAKGGIVVGISHQLKIPIKFIGIGETMDDLRPFDASDFVEAIFG